MKVMVFNCGSSSIKYQLISMEDNSVLCVGLIERIGIEGSLLKHVVDGKKYLFNENIPNHKIGISLIIDKMMDKECGVIKSIDEIDAIGHRVVHGGEKFASSVVITDEVLKAIEDVIPLAPLHNPANLTGIKACSEIMPGKPQVAVFDTAFHQTMDAKSYIYAIPYEYYEKYGVRRYGFHGTSHKFVANEAAEFLEKDIKDLKIITCHIGNGASIAAVKNGKVVDTSMGFTPLAGLVMGTRSGDLDPAVVTFIQEKENKTAAEVDAILNKKSGVEGISGVSSDMRDIEDAAAAGNERAKLALDTYNYRIAKYVGSYAAAMNGVDVVVFTGGVGENSPHTRNDVLTYLEFLGIKVDALNNNSRGKKLLVSTADSKVLAMVIPTNEELAIAKDTEALVK